MTRELSAAALLPIVIGVIWFLPPVATAAFVGSVLTLACVEYARLARAAGIAGPAAAAVGVIYLGLPLGAMVALVLEAGREAVLLLLATVVVSDTAQYYGGRALGRRPLAPMISPRKTVEGAICGVIAATAAFTLIGAWWLPALPPAPRVALGAALALLGIGGDLFESRLKRAAGVKDASNLIPGHGGILDRIDALLFAAPVYYAVIVAFAR